MLWLYTVPALPLPDIHAGEGAGFFTFSPLRYYCRAEWLFGGAVRPLAPEPCATRTCPRAGSSDCLTGRPGSKNGGGPRVKKGLISFYIRPAGTYLNQLAKPGGMLQKHKLGKANYYVNQPLYELLARLG